MNILVTGGAGFIGSNIADCYVSEKHNVIIADDLSNGNEKYLNPKAKFYQVNLISDDLEKIFKENKIDVINHHASQIDLRKSINDPLYDARNNIIAGLRILECAKKYSVKKIIFASSGGAIYDDNYLPSVEDQNVKPLTPYGISKHTIENYLYFYKKFFNLNYIIFRYSNVFGERQGLSKEVGVISIFIKRLLNNKSPYIFGDGKNTRDFVYIRDVVKANLMALDFVQSGLFNISSNKEISVNELFAVIKNNFANDIKCIYKEKILNEQMRSCLSNERAKQVLGWMPGTSFEKAISETVIWFKENNK